MSERNWICLNRKIWQHWLYKIKRKFSKYEAWIDLLLMANYKKDNKFLFGNKLIKQKRGEIITSEVKLAKKWKWSRDKVRGFINLLKTEQMLYSKPDNKKTTLFIINYDKYQNQEQQTRQQTRQQKNIKKTQSTSNNNAITKDIETKSQSWAYNLIIWWEEKNNTKIVDKGKQYGALGRLKKAGYIPQEIKEKILIMEKDKFWADKKPDFVNLAANIHKIKKENSLLYK